MCTEHRQEDSYQSNSMFEPCTEFMLAKKIFTAHRKAMRVAGKVSNLRYVGIGVTVYACMVRTIAAAPRGKSSIFQVVEDDFDIFKLDNEEARDFEYVRLLEEFGL